MLRSPTTRGTIFGLAIPPTPFLFWVDNANKLTFVCSPDILAGSTDVELVPVVVEVALRPLALPARR